MDLLPESGAFPVSATSSNLKLAEWALKEQWNGDHFLVGQGLESAAHFFLVYFHQE